MLITNSYIDMNSTREMDMYDRELFFRREIQAGQNQDRPGRNRRLNLLNRGRNNADRGVKGSNRLGQSPADTGTNRPQGPQLSSTSVTISHQARIQLSRQEIQSRTISEINPAKLKPDDLEKNPQAKVLLLTMEKLTGKKFHVAECRCVKAQEPLAVSVDDIELEPPSSEQIQNPVEAGVQSNATGLAETITHQIHYEREVTTFSTAGKIVTADGREIDIEVELNMSREYYEENIEHTITTTRVSDPLVINFDGKAADLTQTKFSFDLDSDGNKEQISFVNPGSGGFLAYDLNGDGIINDGSELFGPSSGNGFAELADFDEDGNGWIDEGDSIFCDLAVWTKDSSGNDYLLGLLDIGLGAIYLNDVSTEFSVTNADNEKMGQVRSTSVYLNEDGSAGTIQQVDLSVSEDLLQPSNGVDV